MKLITANETFGRRFPLRLGRDAIFGISFRIPESEFTVYLLNDRVPSCDL